MASPVFHFKQFSINQDKCSMKVGTDGVLLGAWTNIHPSTIRILDIGTGTGVISLMLAQRVLQNQPGTIEIDAIDIDCNSCAQARQNVKNSIFKDFIKIHEISLYDFAQKNDRSYDLIVANPPYFNNNLKSENKSKNLARHSDSAQLEPETIINSCMDLLSKKGIFSIILPEKEGLYFYKKAQASGLYCTRLTRVFSKPGKNCLRLLMHFEFSKKSVVEETLFIETGKGLNDFSVEYKALTKEFYLNF